MRQRPLMCLLALLIGLVWTFASPIEGNTPLVEVQSPTDVPADVQRDMGYIPTDDGIKLASMAYRPKREGKFPVIVLFDVYDSSGRAADEVVLAYVSRGYAFVLANARGTGCSEGEYVPYAQPREARDGATVVEWAGTQPWSNGNVGVIGNSHPGIIQFGIGAQQPKHLRALAAGGTISRLYGDGWHGGGIWNPGLAVQWEVGQQDFAKRGAQARIKLGDTACEATLARQAPNRMYELTKQHPFEDDYYRGGSPYDLAPLVQVPMLLVNGWNDAGCGGSAVWVFNRLKTPNKRLLLSNGGHDVYWWSPAREETMRWMDRWVKGEANGIDSEPRVRILFETKRTSARPPSDAYYRGGLPAVPNWSRAFSDWPIPETRRQTLYLTTSGLLSKDKPEASTGAGKKSYFYPAGSEVPSDNALFNAPPVPHGSLTYRTLPVTEDTAIIGSPQLTLYLSSEQRDTDLMVVLHDVAPDGKVLFVQRAYLRASHRAVDAGRSTAEMVFHPHDKAEELQPGRIYEIPISIWPAAHVLRANHALELVIMAPSSVQSRLTTWALTPVMLPGFNTVYHSAEYPSRLTLPIVPSVRAEGPVPECGTLEWQPCRPGQPLAPSSGTR